MGAIAFGTGNDTMTNKNIIDLNFGRTLVFGEGNNKFTTNFDVVGDPGTVDIVKFGGGNDTVTSFGWLVAEGNADPNFVRVALGGGNDTLTNSGTMGVIDFGAGSNKLVNSGSGARVFFGDDAD